eukprot:1195956-Prorocentrum_minimum.AAC.8
MNVTRPSSFAVNLGTIGDCPLNPRVPFAASSQLGTSASPGYSPRSGTILYYITRPPITT